MHGPQHPHAAGFEWCFFSTQMQWHFILKLNWVFLPKPTIVQSFNKLHWQVLAHPVDSLHGFMH